MTQIIRRGAALLLTLALFISLFPAALAAETETSASDEAVLETLEEAQTTEPEITEPPKESPPGETTPEETTVPAAEPTAPSETMPEDLPEMDTPMDFPEDMDTFSIGSTQSSIMLFDYADNGNYTTVLNTQVSCTYKSNGSGTTRTAYIKNLGWHFARYGGVAYPDDPLYCIEPWRNYGASTSGNTVDRDVTLSGSGSTSGSNVWYAMPTARREAIGLILLYSGQMWDHSISVTTTRKDSNPNVPLRIATQFLIYEIVCGLRDPSTFERNYENECGTSGDVFYNAGKASVSGFSSNYNTLVSNIQAAKKIPSFTSSSMGNAPTITLNGTSTSVTDTTGVLSYFIFPNGSGASFSKSGSTLKITQTGTISESTVFKATRYLPSASGSTYNLWYMSGSRKFKMAAGKTLKSILISCGARLAPFDIKELRDLMEYDELELDTLGDSKTALFVILSDTDSTFNFVAALMYSQLFNLLCDKADDFYGGRLPVHVRLILNEFANIGQIPNFDKLIATIRSREISASIILQSQSQLKTIYKDAADTIVGNCDSTLFLGGKEKSTLKEISELLGKETIDLYNQSENRGSQISHGLSYQKLGKELMSQDELAVMDGGKCIFMLRGVRPFLSEKYDLTKHPNYKYTADADPKNVFDMERYMKRKRTVVKPTDTFEVYEINITT